MFGDYQAKGFLTDYSKLSKTPDDDGAYRYRDAAADVGGYNKLLVDRIKVWFRDDCEYKGIDPDELKMLTDYFYEAIEKAIGDDYPMVAEAGPDVMRLRIALTDVEPNKPEASVTSPMKVSLYECARECQPDSCPVMAAQTDTVRLVLEIREQTGPSYRDLMLGPIWRKKQ